MTSIITPEFIAKCKEDFKKADLNGDGVLDATEFKAGNYCSPSQKDQIDLLFSEYKHSGDWKMDVDEFIAMVASTKGVKEDGVDKDLAEFLLFDKDHSGTITIDELHQCMQLSNPGVEIAFEQVQTMFRFMDANGDGHIDYAEYQKVVKATKASTEQEKVDEIHAVFLLIDKDGSGQISVEEFFEFLVATNPGVKVELEQVRGTFKILDTNGDGHIDYDEFRKMASAMTTAIVDEKVDEVRAGFALIDKNGDKVVSPEEFFEFLVATNPGMQISMEAVMAAFKKYDTNGDGFIDFEEFKVMAKELMGK